MPTETRQYLFPEFTPIRLQDKNLIRLKFCNSFCSVLNFYRTEHVTTFCVSKKISPDYLLDVLTQQEEHFVSKDNQKVHDVVTDVNVLIMEKEYFLL